MSFNFKWPTFSDEFHQSAAQMLNSALNRGPKPKVIADDITVEELGMGTIPPELEILEIGDLGMDRFRGIFRLTYAGDAHLVLKTKVQANPLTKPNRTDIGLFPSSTASRGILFAAAPLIVPMHLRLSSVKLRAIVVLVVSKAKGITLVFKNDPLESVEVSSTFDSVAVIQKYLQQEIEGQLREMFREDLPGIIHRLSQRWLSGEAKQARQQSEQQHQQLQPQPPPPPPSASAAATQQYRQSPLPRSSSDPHTNRLETASAPGGPTTRPRSKSRSKHRPSFSASTTGAPSFGPASASPSKPASVAGRSQPSSSPPKTRPPLRRNRHSAKAASTSAAPLYNELMSEPSHPFASTFPEIENYDPTYGLRPDDLPTHSGFSGLGKLAQRVSGGLKDLTSSSPQESSIGTFSGIAGLMDAPLIEERSDEEFAQDQFEFEYDSEGNLLPSPGHHDADLLASSSGSADELEATDESEQEHDGDLYVDDVPDLDLDDPADTSLDYSRFGYPPASAAFSDTQEVNRASSIIFDDEPGSSSNRRSRRESASKGAASVRSGARSVRSVGSRPRSASKIEYETIPAVGGGTVTRPRIYHIASKVQPPEFDWDDESTARPSQVGGAPSSRTAGATTRYGSDMGSTTFGSRANTIRGFNSPQIDHPEHPDDSEESLVELPPESMHSSDPSQHPQAKNLHNSQWRASSSASSASVSARQSSAGWDSGVHTFGALSGSASARGMSWDHSASSTAPTSHHPSTGFSGSASEANAIRPGLTGERAMTDASSGSGIRVRKNKSMARPRPMTSGSLDRAGFVTATYGQGPGASATPPRSKRISPPEVGADLSSSPQGGLHSSSPRQGAGNRNSLSIDASAHFADLVKSNYTLSPFTRNMEHFTVRSAPVTPGLHHSSAASSTTGSGSSVPSAVPPASVVSQPLLPQTTSSPARRRRTFQLGGGSGSGGGVGSGTAGQAKPEPQPHQLPQLDMQTHPAPSSSVPSIKEQRRRSRPDFMGPPSEAARLGAARWGAITE